MRGRKLQTLLCAALLGVSLWLPGQVSAELRTVEADGFYQMGDGMAENQAIAKERARVDAIRSAGEQAATYVESFTAVSNSKVTKDDIRLWTSSVLEVRDVKFTPVVVGESIQFQCHVVAVVDTDKIKEKIQEENMNLKSSLQKYQDENERLRKEMEELKQQYKTAAPEQKKKIDIEVQKNDREYEANSYFEKGRESIQGKDYISAIDYLEKAISLKPDFAWAYDHIGYAYDGLGEYQKAIGYYEKAISLKPDDAVAYNNIGYVYNELGEYQKAIENLEKAISLKPDYARAYKNIGIAYYALFKDQKAIGYFEKAISLNPDYETVYYVLGDIYNDNGDYNKAIEYYEKAIKLQPGYAEAYREMAIAYKHLGNIEKANEYYEKACSLDSKLRNKPI